MTGVEFSALLNLTLGEQLIRSETVSYLAALLVISRVSSLFLYMLLMKKCFVFNFSRNTALCRYFFSQTCILFKHKSFLLHCLHWLFLTERRGTQITPWASRVTDTGRTVEVRPVFAPSQVGGCGLALNWKFEIGFTQGCPSHLLCWIVEFTG